MKYEVPDALLVRAEGPVRVVSLNRPDRLNCFNDELHRGLIGIWDQLADDPEVGAAVLTGEGKAFSAGGDIQGFEKTASDVEHRRWQLRNSRALVDAMLRCPIPVVAAINGPAIGLGCSAAVLCDIVFIDEDAYMADPHVAIGLVAGDGGAATWPLLMSILKVKEFVFTGDRVPAHDAVHFGLANRVTARGTVVEEAVRFATKLAELPRQALQETKRALNIHIQRAAAGVLEFALAAEGESFATDELRARAAKFLEK